MKTLAIILFVLSSSVATAQQHTSISRNINDDGKTLSIRVSGTVDGKPVDYDRTFDVGGLNLAERNALRERILDSLNVSMPEPPIPPAAPRAALAPLAPLAPIAPHHIAPHHTESISITSSGRGENQVVAISGKQPYTKEVNYNSDSGKLFLRYRFVKDGDDFTYERTIDAQNKSQQERQRMIEDIEKTIGVPTTGK